MATRNNSKTSASKPEAKNSKPLPASPAAAPARLPTPMELILAKQAEKKAKQGSRPAPSAKTLGTPQGGGAGGHMNTHAKGGASGVARRTAPGG